MIVLTSALALCNPSQADTTAEVLRGVVVQDARATPTGDGLLLRFSIENTSGRTIVLEDVRAAAAETGSLYVDESGLYRVPAEQLIVLDQETLDLGTSHIGAVLSGFSEDLKSGDVIELELVFRSGIVPVSAHVHEEE